MYIIILRKVDDRKSIGLEERILRNMFRPVKEPEKGEKDITRYNRDLPGETERV